MRRTSLKLIAMGDSAMWVAAFTGGTAVLASWVTNLGNVRAARVQAEASIQAQHRGRVRELRRAAYLELMQRAHDMAELYWKVSDAFLQTPGPQQQLARLEELRIELREAYAPLMQCVRVVALEGPAATADAAQAIQDPPLKVNQCLWHIPAETQTGAIASTLQRPPTGNAKRDSSSERAQRLRPLDHLMAQMCRRTWV
ncbi:hypothetical protein [Streptomyces hayashii]|uniref:hypothetical protein n=1 Tax=Streptomyces hayashii TaxID=2839966 RepID=UPI00403CBE62